MLFYRGGGSGDWWWSVSFIAGILAGRVVVHAIRRMVPVTPPVDGRRGPNAITLIIGRETEYAPRGSRHKERRIMHTLKIGDVTITSIIERDGPWCQPASSPGAGAGDGDCSVGLASEQETSGSRSPSLSSSWPGLSWAGPAISRGTLCRY